jgi:hypothetical protein
VEYLQLLPLFFLFGVPVLVVLGAIVATVLLFKSLRRRAREQGHASLRAYLRAAPRTDEEKRDAADLALKGLILCLLGMIFAPALLFGLIPFFYGARKVVYASMGLGFADPTDQPAR